jgi:hypothetical protein
VKFTLPDASPIKTVKSFRKNRGRPKACSNFLRRPSHFSKLKLSELSRVFSKLSPRGEDYRSDAEVMGIMKGKNGRFLQRKIILSRKEERQGGTRLVNTVNHGMNTTDSMFYGGNSFGKKESDMKYIVGSGIIQTPTFASKSERDSSLSLGKRLCEKIRNSRLQITKSDLSQKVKN